MIPELTQKVKILRYRNTSVSLSPIGEVVVTAYRDRIRLPLLSGVPRGRQALTCRYRCGDACRHEPPNHSDNPSFGEVVGPVTSTCLRPGRHFPGDPLRKRQRRLNGVDEIVLSLSARGLTTGGHCCIGRSPQTGRLGQCVVVLPECPRRSLASAVSAYHRR